MALRNLSTGSMVTISSEWLDPKRARAVFTSVPLLASLEATLHAAHDGLVAMQTTPKRQAQSAADAIATEQASAVARLDRKARGLFNTLTGIADLTDDPDEGTALLDARDKLFPEGLRAQGRSYDDKVAHAELVPARLDAATHALFASIKIKGTATLDTEVKKWLDTSRTLGKLASKRDALKADAATSPGVTKADVTAARNAWIRAVKAVRTNFDLAPDPSLYEKLFGPLDRAEARADRRDSLHAQVSSTTGDPPAASPQATNPSDPNAGATSPSGA